MDLYRVLPKTGKIQYNSYNKIPYQPIIKKIMNDQENEISSIKETELKKFYEGVGNYILQKYHKTKYLNEKKVKSYIHRIANEQQNKIKRNIEEYNRRMEEQLIV